MTAVFNARQRILALVSNRVITDWRSWEQTSEESGTPQRFLGEDVSFRVGSISLRNRKSRGKHLWQRFLALIHNLLRKGQLIVCLQLIEAYNVRARERTCKRVYVFKSSRASFPAVRGTFLHQFLHFNSGPRAPMSMTKNIYTVNTFFKDWNTIGTDKHTTPSSYFDVSF